ncbi:MAG: hypothetical protein DLM59_03060 [Pseudonocardiales bacterium]|nr:MAG: hypothetical protein DLM59_03060 [Pseudonocardiales bacterium]
MTQLAYDPGIIGPAIGDIKAAATDLHATHEDIKGSMAKVQQTWLAGDDLDKYKTYQTAWDTIFAEVNVALDKLGVIAQGCLDNAMQCQAKNASMWPDA